jgi:hypothetical protein
MKMTKYRMVGKRSQCNLHVPGGGSDVSGERGGCDACGTCGERDRLMAAV